MNRIHKIIGNDQREISGLGSGEVVRAVRERVDKLLEHYCYNVNFNCISDIHGHSSASGCDWPRPLLLFLLCSAYLSFLCSFFCISKCYWRGRSRAAFRRKCSVAFYFFRRVWIDQCNTFSLRIWLRRWISAATSLSFSLAKILGIPSFSSSCSYRLVLLRTFSLDLNGRLSARDLVTINGWNTFGTLSIALYSESGLRIGSNFLSTRSS